jgi:hypothetical protein
MHLRVSARSACGKISPSFPYWGNRLLSGPGPLVRSAWPLLIPSRGSFLRGSYRSTSHNTNPYVPSQEIKASYVSLNVYADPLDVVMPTMLHDALTTS